MGGERLSLYKAPLKSGATYKCLITIRIRSCYKSLKRHKSAQNLQETTQFFLVMQLKCIAIKWSYEMSHSRIRWPMQERFGLHFWPVLSPSSSPLSLILQSARSFLQSSLEKVTDVDKVVFFKPFSPNGWEMIENYQKHNKLKIAIFIFMTCKKQE